MSLAEFQTGLLRLSEQFGKNAYSQARAEIIWREVKDFSRSWWEKTVDAFLFTCRQAPLYQEFADKIGEERERLWKIEKAKNDKDAKDFFAGTYLPEDVKTICQMITRRVQGKISDQDYSTFVEHLDHAAKNPSQKSTEIVCRDCENRGIVWVKDAQNYEWTCRCHCRAGDKHSRAYPVYKRRAC